MDRRPKDSGPRLAGHWVLLICVTAFCAGRLQGAPESTMAEARETENALGDALKQLLERLERRTQDLSELRSRIADEKLPLARRLSELEKQLETARTDYEGVKRLLDRRTLDMSNLRSEIKTRETEKAYLESLLGEYIRNFETRLHIAERPVHQHDIEAARLAPENAGLSPAERLGLQAGLIETGMERIEDLLGGVRYAGRAAGEDGLVKKGHFVLLGPVAYFASEDGTLSGIAEERVNSMEAYVADYADPVATDRTRRLVESGTGLMPFDASLGNARKIEETRESLFDHMKKGGVVMYPILGLASCAFLVAVIKWASLSFVFLPGDSRLRPLMTAVAKGDAEAARCAAIRIGGPAGRMLRAGIDQLRGPRELIEEVMYERLLATRFAFNRALPFIAVSAACAPLLGLLGTVTGIINTFKLITVFGSGDVKMLSGGISEALITTEFGLIIAIPTILMHAFLSRKSKTLVDKMERMAIRLLSEVERSRNRPTGAEAA